MGLGSYRASDWARLRSSKGLTQLSSVENVFANQSVSSAFDPRGIVVRESRDSSDSPRSTPIIIGFDVTASMGYLAKELAVNAVNRAVTQLCRSKPISDPHVLCAAIGDSKCDASPLQVTQFEADIRIISQLTSLYLEGGGGGNGGESYHLLWYFADRHTSSDCWQKRHEKGCLFTIGDDVPYALSNEELIRAAQEKYHLFHIHIETESAASRAIFGRWQRLLPGHTASIQRKDINCISDLMTAIIGVTSGKSVNEALNQMEPTAAEKIARSMSLIHIGQQQTKRLSF